MKASPLSWTGRILPRRAVHQGAEDERLVLGVVVGAVGQGGVLRRQRQEALEVLLVGLVPADAQPPHRERLGVERLVPERIRHPVALEVPGDIRPVEDRVVPDEGRAAAFGLQALGDEGREAAHRLGRLDPFLLEVLALEAMHLHGAGVEAGRDRLQLDVEALRLALPGAVVVRHDDRADRDQVEQRGHRARGLDVDAEEDVAHAAHWILLIRCQPNGLRTPSKGHSPISPTARAKATSPNPGTIWSRPYSPGAGTWPSPTMV